MNICTMGCGCVGRKRFFTSLTSQSDLMLLSASYWVGASRTHSPCPMMTAIKNTHVPENPKQTLQALHNFVP